MRIFDDKNNRTLRNVTLLLKEEEARELIQGLISLLDNPDDHVHVIDKTYEHEITAAI